jgi:hypothetical protein
MSDRDAFREARDAGLRARHETREARAVRKAVAEEIAVACEHDATFDTFARYHFARIAREIGSRDPE